MSGNIPLEMKTGTSGSGNTVIRPIISELSLILSVYTLFTKKAMNIAIAYATWRNKECKQRNNNHMERESEESEENEINVNQDIIEKSFKREILNDLTSPTMKILGKLYSRIDHTGTSDKPTLTLHDLQELPTELLTTMFNSIYTQLMADTSTGVFDEFNSVQNVMSSILFNTEDEDNSDTHCKLDSCTDVNNMSTEELNDMCDSVDKAIEEWDALDRSKLDSFQQRVIEKIDTILQSMRDEEE